MKYNRTVILQDNEIQKCIDFGKKFADEKSQKSSKDFGSREAYERDLTDKTADTIAGKLGEYAFMKFCDKHGLSIKIDFEITVGKLNIDNGQDISLENNKELKTKFDIKESKKWAQWLLIESHKIDKAIISSDVYIFVRLTLPANIEKNLDAFNVRTIEAEISGYALNKDFFDEQDRPWFKYEHSKHLLKAKFVKAILDEAYLNKTINTPIVRDDLNNAYRKIQSNFRHEEKFIKTPLKADLNIGIPVFKLRKSNEEFDLLFKMIKNDQYNENLSSIL